jgi:hypothetical protein
MISDLLLSRLGDSDRVTTASVDSPAGGDYPHGRSNKEPDLALRGRLGHFPRFTRAAPSMAALVAGVARLCKPTPAVHIRRSGNVPASPSRVAIREGDILLAVMRALMGLNPALSQWVGESFVGAGFGPARGSCHRLQI